MDFHDDAVKFTVVKTLHQTDSKTGITIARIVAKNDADGRYMAVVQPAGSADIQDGTKVFLEDLTFNKSAMDDDHLTQFIFVPRK